MSNFGVLTVAANGLFHSYIIEVLENIKAMYRSLSKLLGLLPRRPMLLVKNPPRSAVTVNLTISKNKTNQLNGVKCKSDTKKKG